MILAAFAVLTLTYWVQPAKTASDEQLAVWALADWAKASGGQLVWKPVSKPSEARIRILWAAGPDGLYGQARGGDVFVSTAMAETNDALLRDTVVYLTCLHESGHALGLEHTAGFEDIMYNFRYGGDIREYFQRYRRRLKERGDIAQNSGLSASDRKRLLLALPAFRRALGCVAAQAWGLKDIARSVNSPRAPYLPSTVVNRLSGRPGSTGQLVC